MPIRQRTCLGARLILVGAVSSGCVTTARSPGLHQRQHTFAAPVPAVLSAAEVVLSRHGVPTDTLNLAGGELLGVNFFEDWRDGTVGHRVDCGASFLAENLGNDLAPISVRLDTFATPTEEGTLLEFRTTGQQGDHPCAHKRGFLAKLFKAIEVELAAARR